MSGRSPVAGWRCGPRAGYRQYRQPIFPNHYGLINNQSLGPGRDSAGAGDEPFAVEHGRHDAPGEQVESQQGCGEPTARAADSEITY